MDVIVGNPPFLGGNKIRAELGDEYVNALFKLYEGRVPAFADLVCYWFEKARAMIESGKVKRVGLLATNSIRGGANRKVLQRIKETGNIFWAQSNRDWVLDGAAVNVSMIGFDDNREVQFVLDDQVVNVINSDLTGTSSDTTTAKTLTENLSMFYRPDEKGGPFDITFGQAQEMLRSSNNPNGRPNSDVVRPYLNARDIVQSPSNTWIIDFGVDAEISEASKYEIPFEYIKKVVKPVRDKSNNKLEKEFWWLHRRPAPDMREAVKNLTRFIVTPRVAKHRIFVWVEGATIPDSSTYIFARDDDYFFGILHSKLHEIWALKQGTSLEDRPRYTPTTTFETFPFPWAPGQEPKNDPRVQAISQAAKELVEQRDRWLNPESQTLKVSETFRVSDDEKKKRTLTNLYNQRPTWLDLAHKRLDEAVFAAYGWESDLSDEEILEKLLALNLERGK